MRFEGIRLQQIFKKGIAPFAKLHRRGTIGEAGKGNPMAAFMEPPGIVSGWGLVRHLMVDTDYGPLGNQPDDGFWRAAEQQAALHCRDRGNVIAAALPQFGTEHLLVDHVSLRAGVGDGTTLGRCREIL